MRSSTSGCVDWLASAVHAGTVPVVPEGMHPDDVAAAAEEHGIAALLWQALDGSTGNVAAVRRALDVSTRAAVGRETFVQRELSTVLAALDAHGVSSLVIKGAALAYTSYPRPWLRPRVDTDLLVSAAAVRTASTVLSACGYVRSDALNTASLVTHQIAFERVDEHDINHVVDLHWKIANPQVVADAVSFEDLWMRARSAPALGPAARVPGIAESIMLACVHRLAHHQGHDRLIWLYDLKLLSSQLDNTQWDALCSLAVARGIAALCLDGLREARARVGGSLPPAAELALAAAAPNEESRSYVQQRVRKRDVLVSDLRLLDWGSRLQLVRGHLFPPAAFIRHRYRTKHRLLLPAFYLHRLLTGASRWVSG